MSLNDSQGMPETSWYQMFGEEDGSVIGHRLGVSYMESTKEYITLTVDDQTLKLYQTAMGIMAISGVVWDAGLCLADYLIANRDVASGEVLDLGCGTGVCGITALLLGANTVTFSDIVEPPSFDENIGQLSENSQLRLQFVPFDWSTEILCEQLVAPALSNSAEGSSDGKEHSSSNDSTQSWDTVLCSDLLYDKKAHVPLLRVLRQIRFKRAVFGYKRRHDEPEREFFRLLSQHYSISVVTPDRFPLSNCPPNATSGVFIVIATPI